MKNRPKRLARRTIYESKWINLHVDKVEMPGGRVVEDMHVLDYPSEGVGVVVVDDEERILLEYAYRYHTGNDGWEIPAGGVDEGESVLEAGRREVLEETGYETKDHKLVYTYNPSNGSSNQILNVVFCRAVRSPPRSFDANEVREVKWFTKDEVKKLIESKEIVDGLALIGLLLFLEGLAP